MELLLQCLHTYGVEGHLHGCRTVDTPRTLPLEFFPSRFLRHLDIVAYWFMPQPFIVMLHVDRVLHGCDAGGVLVFERGNVRPWEYPGGSPSPPRPAVGWCSLESVTFYCDASTTHGGTETSRRSVWFMDDVPKQDEFF